MPTHRPRLRRARRILLVLLGVLLPTGVGFLALGWAVSRYRTKIDSVLGAGKAQALEEWYFRAAAVLAPGDRDDDGWRDGLEWMLRTDWRKARSHPRFEMRRVGYPHGIFLGERQTLRWRLQAPMDHEAPLPRGFQVMVWTETATLLAKGAAGEPTPGPLVLTPNPQGELEFDLLVDTLTVQKINAEPGVFVTFLGVAQGIPLGVGYCPTLGWRRGPAQAAVFTDERGKPLTRPPDPHTRPREQRVFIASPGETGTAYLIEARRKIPGADWESKAWRDKLLHERPFLELCEDGSWSRDTWQPEDQIGDFEIRVVPVSDYPP